MATILGGGCVELCSNIFEPSWFWYRFKQGDVTIFHSAPAYLAHLAVFFDTDIRNKSALPHFSFIDGVRKVRILACSGAFLTQSTIRLWAELRPGQPLLNHYGTTETASVAYNMDWGHKEAVLLLQFDLLEELLAG